jgi:dienelactone hydrolase
MPTIDDKPAARLPLPELLRTTSGAPVSDARAWQDVRRPELLELFRTHVFGRAPVGRPKSLAFRIELTDPAAMGGAATRKDVAITYRGPGGEGQIDLLMFVPNARTGPAPVALLLNNRGPENTDPTRVKQGQFWPAERIVARGYAAAVFRVADIDPDDKADVSFRDGVHGIFDHYAGERPGDAWATIAAWAWGFSRVMDYLETDGDIDAARVIAVGHSRGGKTALWAGAQDERFAMVVSNQSGSTGAAISRGKQGETVALINNNFPHWFCANYKRYNDREADLPIDQHMLLALTAPRLLYVASAAEDLWSDPAGEFRSAVEASSAWRLFGGTGFPAGAKMPPVDEPLHADRVGYHVRAGKHSLNEYDWDQFLNFADARLPANASSGRGSSR